MPTVIVNNKPVEIGPTEKLNCIQVAQRAGDEIPSYCWHQRIFRLSPVVACAWSKSARKKPDGSIAMQPKLSPGCQTPVKDGMVIVSNSEKGSGSCRRRRWNTCC